MTITSNTKLDRDLTNCAANGIVIGANNITLDLNGHTIDGDGVGFDVGVDNPGHDGVSVEGGKVAEFFFGLRISDAQRNRVRSLTAADNADAGIFLFGSADSQVETSVVVRSPVGIVIEDCSRIAIERNSTFRDSEGIVLLSSLDSRMAANLSFDNINGIGLNDSDRNVIEANVLFRNENGIYAVSGSDYNALKDNVATSNTAAGIEIDNGHNLITRNVLRDNSFVGIAVVGGDDNRIDQNSISANGDGSEGGIHLISMDEDTSDRNLLLNNSLIGNVGDGILVDRGQSQTVIEDNVADKNTDDGIDTDSRSTTLSGNTANRNHDLGVEAVPGVRDGGGNKARFNGNPLQCTNLAC